LLISLLVDLQTLRYFSRSFSLRVRCQRRSKRRRSRLAATVSADSHLEMVLGGRRTHQTNTDASSQSPTCPYCPVENPTRQTNTGASSQSPTCPCCPVENPTRQTNTDTAVVL